MNYNWEEIFKSKSTKELYEIYSGNSFLPNEAIPLAQKELKKRDFDFNNLQYYYNIWKLESITEEIDFSEFDLFNRGFFTLDSILSFLIISFAFLIYFTWKHNDVRYAFLFGVFIIIFLIAIFILNYIYLKKIKHLNLLIEARKILIDKISKQDIKNKHNEIIDKIQTKSNRRKRNYQIFVFVISLLLSLYCVYCFFLK
jgi:hypothetical protein